MYGYIYETTNLINGRKYIGQKKSPEFVPSYKGSGTIIELAIRKYGKDNFSVRMLCPCFSQEELDAEEIDYIAHCNAVNSPDYYNLAVGGQGIRAGSKCSIEHNINTSLGLLGKSKSEEHRRHISESKTGSNNPMYGKQHSDEWKEKMSERMSGSNNPFYGKRWTPEMYAAHQGGYTLSDETRKRMSETRQKKGVWNSGVPCSEETRAKISQANKGRKFVGRTYKKICRVCGEQFLGTGPKSSICDNCK